MITNSEEAMNNLRASNPKSQDSDVSRAMPNFGQRYQARMIRRFSIGFAAIAVLSVPAVLNFVGQGGAGDEVQISSEVIDGVKGATKKSGKKAANSTQSVSFAGAPSLELGALSSELVGADQNFRSVRDGFSFPNYSGKPTNDEIDATVMAALFGKEAVCADKNAALCAMLPGAQAVADQLNEAMASGRCEGMAVLAQRFYDGMENRPNGAASTGQIAQDVVAKQIGYWWATQVAPTVAANSKLYRSMSPTQITSELITGLRNRSGFTLGLYSAAGGHAVTPIAVTKDGENFNIYVYDNNYPGEIRKVLVNSATQSWTYGAAALSAGAQSSTWSGTGAGSMDLTSMASRQDRPFKVSLGGTKGIKGTSYSVIVTQQGNSTVPLGFKLSHRFGELNSLNTKSVATATFPVKSFLGAGGNQGAIAFIPTALSDVSGMKLEIVGGKNTGKYTVSIMRTGSTGAVVESNSKFDISVMNTSFSTVLGVDLLDPSQKALVRLSNGNAGVDVRLVDGQSVEVTSPTTYDDAFRGARRIESTGPPFVISKWSGEEIASGIVEQNLSKGEAKIVKFAVNSQTGKVNQRFTDTTKSIIDEVFVRTLVPGKNYLNYDTVTKKPSAALIDVFNPIQLPTRAIAGPTTTTTTPISTTTTVAPAVPSAPPAPAPTTTLAPESVVVTLSAQRYYGDTNSSITDKSWKVTCEDSNSAETGCSFLNEAMKTSSMSDLMTMSLPEVTANFGTYDLSAEMKEVAGWPSNYSAEIVVQLEVMKRQITVIADDRTVAFGEILPSRTYQVVEDEDLNLKGDLAFVGFPVNAGPYVISQGTLTNENNPNYDITFNDGTLTITKIEQDALVVTTTGVVYGSSVGLTYSGGSGTGDVSYTVVTGKDNCSINASTLSALGAAGTTCTVKATRATSTNYFEKESSEATITVTKAEQGPLAVVTTGVVYGSSVGLTYSGGSGTGDVSYTVVTGKDNCSINASTLSATGDAGTTCTVTATRATSTNYFEKESSEATITVTKAEQGPLAMNSATVVYGSNVVLGLTTGSVGSGDGLVSYAVVTAGTANCSIDGSTLTATGDAGTTCTVTATRATSTNYLEKMSSEATITVTKAEQGPLAMNSATVVYGSNVVLGLTTGSVGSGDGDVSYAVATGSENCSIDGSTLTATGDAGTSCTVKATRATSTNYLEKMSSEATITVTKAEQDALAVATSGVVYGSNVVLGLTTGSVGSGDGDVSYTVVTAGTANCSIDGSTLTATGDAGTTCTVKATRATSTNYLEKMSSEATITVAKRPISVIADDIEIEFGKRMPKLTYQIVTREKFELVGELSIDNESVNAGKYVISQGKLINTSNLNFDIISFTNGTLTITKAEQGPLAVATSGVVYGSNVVLGLTTGSVGSGDGLVSYAVVTAGTANCSIDGSTLTATGDAGTTCTVTATRATSTNYFAKTSESVTITVTKAEQDALAVATSGVVYGSNVVLGLTTGSVGSGDGDVSYTVATGSENCSIDGSTLTATGDAGTTCTVTATRATSTNYLEKMSSEATITVTKAEQGPLAMNSATVVYGSNVVLGLTTGSVGSGDGDVSYTVATGSENCSIDGSTLTATGDAGTTCTVTATRATSTNYLEKMSSEATITVTKAEQGPLAMNSATVVYGSNVVLGLTTGSVGSGDGLVSYAVVTAGTANCSIDGSTLTATGDAGTTCTVKATRATSTNYFAKTSESVTITVTKAEQDALAVATSGVVYGSNVVLGLTTGSVGSGDGDVSYTVASAGAAKCSIDGSTLTATGDAGTTCTVKATRATSTNYFAKTSLPKTITVTKAEQGPLAMNSATVVYGSNVVLGLTTGSVGSGDGDVSYAVATGSENCSIDGSTLTATGDAGTSCTVKATRATSTNYLEKMSSEATITVTKAEQDALAVATSGVVYGSNVVLGLTTGSEGSGRGDVSYTVVTAGTANCSIDGSTLTATGDAGTTCTVKATRATSTNYFAKTSAPVIITVAKRPITVKADNQTIIFGSSKGPLTYIVVEDNALRLNGELAVVGPHVNAGDYEISQGSLNETNNSNYDIEFTKGTLTITPKPVVVTVQVGSNSIENGSSTVASVTISEPTNFSTSWEGNEYCTVVSTGTNTATVTGVDEGNCRITATVTVSSNYSSTPAWVDIVVTKPVNGNCGIGQKKPDPNTPGCDKGVADKD